MINASFSWALAEAMAVTERKSVAGTGGLLGRLPESQTELLSQTGIPDLRGST